LWRRGPQNQLPRRQEEQPPGWGYGSPEVRVETQVDPLPGASTDVVACEPIIEEAVSIHSAPVPEATSTSCGGLELLDDNLIDPAIITQSMESWRHTKRWIKVRCEYPD
jgi:hypothetical protein